MEEPEKRFTDGYDTGSVNDIIAPFVEREAQIKDILEKLKDHSDITFQNKMDRGSSAQTPYVVWRSYPPSYFMNSLLKDLYP